MSLEFTILSLLILVGVLLVSVILHEIMHGLVAYKLGDDTAYLSGRLTLKPWRHIDPFGTILLPVMLFAIGLPPFGAAKPVPVDFRKLKFDEFGMALVAISGPLTNLALASALAIFYRFGVGVVPDLLLDLARFAITINLSLFVFNMIPFPPLDGSRLLYALAPEPVQDFMKVIESMGLMSIIFFMFLIFPLLRPALVESVLILESILF